MTVSEFEVGDDGQRHEGHGDEGRLHRTANVAHHLAEHHRSESYHYQYTPDNNPQFCNTLVSLRLNPCLMHYAGVDDESQLPDTDYAQAISSYLLSHGMSQQQLDALVQALTTP